MRDPAKTEGKRLHCNHGMARGVRTQRLSFAGAEMFAHTRAIYFGGGCKEGTRRTLRSEV